MTPRIVCLLPMDVPAWVPTTIRIKHYGDIGEAGRQARVAKLRDADPEGLFGHCYENLPLRPAGSHLSRLEGV
jgi:hypothetical protein